MKIQSIVIVLLLSINPWCAKAGASFVSPDGRMNQVGKFHRAEPPSTRGNPPSTNGTPSFPKVNPPRLGGNPPNIGGNPPNMGGTPFSKNGNPPNRGDNPPNTGDTPSYPNGNPPNRGDNPPNTGDTPSYPNGNPPNKGGNPPNTGDTPSYPNAIPPSAGSNQGGGSVDLWAYNLYPTEKKLTGRGVTVAVADSGISPHVEFNGKNILGQDFTLSSSIADWKSHGTGIVGIIGARGEKFTGIAPEAQIIVYKIDDGSKMIGPKAATAAINTLLDYNAKNPDNKIAVLNLSYGAANGGDVELTNAINRAHDSGVFVVCPAGNVGFPGVYYPAKLGSTIAVGALAADAKHAYVNSSYGNEVDFIAPGDLVYTTSADGSYVSMSGTSAAAGFVSATAALAVEGLRKKLGRYPTFDEIKQALIAAAVRVPGAKREQQGYGFIDVKRLEEQLK